MHDFFAAFTYYTGRFVCEEGSIEGSGGSSPLVRKSEIFSLLILTGCGTPRRFRQETSPY